MINIHNLCKVYVTQAERVTALKDINLTIGDGELVAFSGHSGSGKTTLLNLIGTLDSITGGSIEINGNDLTSMTEKMKTAFRKNNLGFIFQSYNLIPVLSAYENVELAFRAFSSRELADLGITDVKTAVVNALQDVGLGNFMNRKPGELSGGQQQRVSIARAIVRKPSLVLADEPTANLDSENSRAILKLLGQMNSRYGMTVIYSSHDPEVLANVDRIITLKDGTVISDKRCHE